MLATLALMNEISFRTVNANDPEFTLPEEEEDYDWHTAGYYHEDEDAA